MLIRYSLFSLKSAKTKTIYVFTVHSFSYFNNIISNFFPFECVWVCLSSVLEKTTENRYNFKFCLLFKWCLRKLALRMKTITIIVLVLLEQCSMLIARSHFLLDLHRAPCIQTRTHARCNLYSNPYLVKIFVTKQISLFGLIHMK